MHKEQFWNSLGLNVKDSNPRSHLGCTENITLSFISAYIPDFPQI